MSLLFGIFFIFLGMSSCYLLISLFSFRLKAIPSLLLSFASLTSIVPVIGYLAYRANVILDRKIFFAFFFLLLTAEISYMKMRKINIPLPRIDKSIGLPAMLLAFSFFLYLYPSFPSFFPVSWEVDSATHFNLINHIWQDKTLFTEASEARWAFRWDYPFSMHLNIALLSWIFDCEPIRMVSLYLSLMSALAILAVYEISSSICRTKYAPFLSCIFAATSIFPFEALVRGFWAAELGIFLCLIFIVALKEYEREPDSKKIAFLALLETGIIMTYVFWIFIPLFALFFFILFFERKRVPDLLLFILIVLVLASDLLFFQYSAHKNIASQLESPGGTTPITLLNLGLLPITLSFFGLIPTLKSGHKSLFIFLLLCGLQTAVIYNYGYYYFAKNFFLLTYIISVLAAYGSEHLLPSFKRRLASNFKNGVAIGLVGIVLLQAGHIKMYMDIPTSLFNTESVMTPEQYDVAVWTKKNLYGGKLAYIANPPKAYWFYAVSGHYLETEEKSWWIKPALDFDGWVSDASMGEIIVILDLEKQWNYSPLQNRSDGYFKVLGNYNVNQSFVPVNSRVDNVSIYIYKMGNPKEIIMKLADKDGLVKSSEIHLGAIKEKAWIQITFMIDAPVRSGAEYQLNFSITGGDTNSYVLIAASSKDAYEHGEVYATREGRLSEWDLYFLVSPKFVREGETILYKGYTFKILYEKGDNFVLKLISIATSPSSCQRRLKAEEGD